MSKKVLKNRFYENEDDYEDVEEDFKCPPGQATRSNLKEDWESQKNEESLAMEEGVPLEEKEKIAGADPQNIAAKEGIGPSWRTDDSPGAEVLDTGMHHPTEGRRRQIPQRVFPGAYREGGPDNEDEGYNEDELTVRSHTEPPIPPTLSAEPVNTAEEERQVQDRVDQALQRERQLVQDQIDQALQRELRNLSLISLSVIVIRYNSSPSFISSSPRDGSVFGWHDVECWLGRKDCSDWRWR